MSKLWKCDFPGCTKETKDRKDWREIEAEDDGDWWSTWVYCAIPIFGNILCLVFSISRQRAILCPEHWMAIFKKGK